MQMSFRCDYTHGFYRSTVTTSNKHDSRTYFYHYTIILSVLSQIFDVFTNLAHQYYLGLE